MTPEQEARKIRARELHGEGWTFTAIARELGVSFPTAKKYCNGLGLPNNVQSARGRGESRRNPRNTGLATLDQKTQGFDLVLSGKTIRDAADEVGVDRRTLQRWIDDEIEQRIAPRVEQLRIMGNARLDQYRLWAWEVGRESEGELRLKAIDRLLLIERRWSALNGTDSPVRVEAVYHEKTQADIELEELLREAQARNAVIEAEIVDDADTAATD